MFEGRKIKRLIEQLCMETEDKERSVLLSQIAEFGEDAFPYVVEAVKNKQIDSLRAKTLLEKVFDKSYIDIFIPLIGDSNDLIRETAKEIILKKAKEEDVIPKLIEKLHDANVHLKTSAKEILYELKSHKSVSGLISIYHNGNKDLKMNIISILSEIGGEIVNNFLINALKEKDRFIQLMVIRGLCKIRDTSSIEPLIELLYEKDIQIKRSIIDALYAIGDKRAARPLLPLLKDDNLLIRQRAMDCICQIANADIVPDILALLRDKDVNVRRCAVAILNNIQDPKTGDELIKSMKDSDWWVREIATEALAELKGDNIIRAMCAMLKDQEVNIRRCAVEFFNKVVVKSAIEPLIGALNDPDWWVREKAIIALGKTKEPSTIKPIAEMINDEEIKWVIPSALGQIGGKDIINPLLELLKDSQKQVRIEALRVFAKLKYREIVSDIKQLLNDPEEDVRNEAASILKAITGRVLKPSKERYEVKFPLKTSVIRHNSTDQSGGGGTVFKEAVLAITISNLENVANKLDNQPEFNHSSVLTDMARSLAKRENCQYVRVTDAGFLMTFPSVGNALRFAVDLLKNVEQYNNTVDETSVIQLKFAINFGETNVTPNGERFGELIDITMRLYALQSEDIIEVEGCINNREILNRVSILAVENAVEEAEQIEGTKTKLLGLYKLEGMPVEQRIFAIIIKV